jgi:hypothetical protein
MPSLRVVKDLDIVEQLLLRGGVVLEAFAQLDVLRPVVGGGAGRLQDGAGCERAHVTSCCRWTALVAQPTTNREWRSRTTAR